MTSTLYVRFSDKPTKTAEDVTFLPTVGSLQLTKTFDVLTMATVLTEYHPQLGRFKGTHR
jgi:hypothetical protein